MHLYVPVAFLWGGSGSYVQNWKQKIKTSFASKLTKKLLRLYSEWKHSNTEALTQLCALDDIIVKDSSLVSLTVQTYFATAGGSTCLNLAKLNRVRPDLYLDQRLQEISRL